MKLRHADLSLQADKAWLDAYLAHAPHVRGLILVAQTAAGSRRDSREAHAAQTLHEAGYATLIVDLVHRHEDARDGDIRYNIPLLASRISHVLEWIAHQPLLGALPLGLLAAGNGCAAAIRALAADPGAVQALVCRGGRPDLAGAAPLRLLTLPTRCILGELDANRAALENAYAHLAATPRDRQPIAGASEHFMEPGTLDKASRLACAWFERFVLPLPQAPLPGT